MNTSNNSPGGEARSKMPDFKDHQSFAGIRRSMDRSEMSKIGTLGGKETQKNRVYLWFVGVKYLDIFRSEVFLYFSTQLPGLELFDYDFYFKWRFPLKRLKKDREFLLSYLIHITANDNIKNVSWEKK